MAPEDNLSSSIRHAAKWSAITNIMRKLVSPLTNMALARILAPDAFGVVATINIVISFADIFTDAGFQKYLVQHEFEDEESKDRAASVAFWTNLSLSTAIWLIIVLFRNSIAALVGSADYGVHLAVAAFAIPMLSFSSIQQALFRRNFDYKSMFAARMVNTLVPVFVTIPLAFVLRNCWALILGTLTQHVLDAVILTAKSKWKPKFSYSFSELKKMLSFTIWTMIEALSIWLSINIDVFILGRILSDYELGLYKTSLTSVNQITNIVTSTVVPVLFAALARTQSDDQKFQDTLFSFINKCALLLIPMSVGIFVYSDVATWILLGEQWMEATFFVGITGLIQAFIIMIANFASEVYRAKGLPKLSTFVQVSYICMFIPCLLYGARQDFRTLCEIRTICRILFILMHLLIMRHRFGMKLKRYFVNMIQPLIASGVMAAAGCIMHSMIPSLAGKMISILCCMIIYGIMCMLLPGTRSAIQQIIGRRRL